MKAALAILLMTGSTAAAGPGGVEKKVKDHEVVATFSIVAADPETGEIGVAVASKFLAVGTVVPWAKAGVGAVATQSLANTKYGPQGLALLESGSSPEEVIKKLTTEDLRREFRQVGIIDASGQAATYTGEKCIPNALGKKGKNYAIQGNLLASEKVVDAMARSFEKSKGTLAERMIKALGAGQAAGGDKRGRQSTALLVVREGWGFGRQNDRFRDLRVDDHKTPITELKRLLKLHQETFPRPEAFTDEESAKE